MGKMERVKLVELDYSNPVDNSIVMKDEFVVIVDYSFGERTFSELTGILEKSHNVLWLDHHITSKEMIESLSKAELKNLKTNGLIYEIDMDRCGAKIAYDRLFSKTTHYKNMQFTFIDYIDDFDRWTKQFENSMLFKLAMDSEDQTPKSKIWDLLLVSEHHALAKLIEAGTTIKTYDDAKNLKDFNRLSYASSIAGMKCIAINKTGNSTVLCDALSKFPLGVVWTFDGKKYTYSLYSSDESVDCEKIAKLFGGGGHRQAAGFSSTRKILGKRMELI